MQAARGRILVVGDRDTLPLFRAIGARVVEAGSEDEALEAIRREAGRGDIAVAIVLKHIVGDEEEFRAKASRLGVPVLVLPGRGAEARPVDVNRLVARALGLG